MIAFGNRCGDDFKSVNLLKFVVYYFLLLLLLFSSKVREQETHLHVCMQWCVCVYVCMRSIVHMWDEWMWQFTGISPQRAHRSHTEYGKKQHSTENCTFDLFRKLDSIAFIYRVHIKFHFSINQQFCSIFEKFVCVLFLFCSTCSADDRFIVQPKRIDSKQFRALTTCYQQNHYEVRFNCIPRTSRGHANISICKYWRRFVFRWIISHWDRQPVIKLEHCFA